MSASEVAGGVRVAPEAKEGARGALEGRCKVIGCSVTLRYGRWTHDSMRELVLCMATRVRA